MGMRTGLRAVGFVLAFSTVAATPRGAFAQVTGGDPTSPAPASTPGTPTAATPPTPAPAPSPAAPPTGAASGSASGTGRTTIVVAPPGPTANGLPAIDTAADSKELAKQGADRPTDAEGRPTDVFSEDWWGRTRPVLELHGYFRTRGELLHNFTLGRHEDGGAAMWGQPLDSTYTDPNGTEHAVRLCGTDPANLSNCADKSQASGNLRLRLTPEIHISDNLRVLSQFDLLDNLVLGSTPDSFGNSANRYSGTGTNFNSQTQTSLGNTISLKRAWAEYVTPVGQVRFGRMPDHWGLGMVHNGGDHIDADFQSTVDRIQFITGLRSADLYFGASWDFVGSGPFRTDREQAYSAGNLTNVDQWSAFIARRMNPELQRLSLARGEVVLNVGAYAYYRKQLLDVSDTFGTANPGNNNGLIRRNADSLVPDLWVQLLWNKFRFEAEGAMNWGSTETPGSTAVTEIRQYGVATQTEFKAVEDKLKLNFGFGWASGDPWVEGLGAPDTAPRLGGGAISTFRFNPAYNIDLIFWRRIMQRIEGAYYFRPSVEYDFLRNPNGQRFGGNAAIIWSRASEFVQTPGNRRDLGVELNLSLYYQAKDGGLNDNPEKLGGFYTALQYGVFFPLGGLDYLPSQKTPLLPSWETSSAQTVRLFLGVAF